MKQTLLFLFICITSIAYAQSPKVNPAIQWQKSLGGSNDDVVGVGQNFFPAPGSIQQTRDGGYILAGTSNSNDGDVSGNHGGYDYWIVKLNSEGTIQWQKSLGGTNDDFGQSIQQTKDGGYIVAGSSTSNDGDVSGNHGSVDYWIVKLDNVGTIQWQKSLGGTNDESASSIQQTKDGGYIVAGYSTSNDGDVSGNHGGFDNWIVKLNSTGAIQWQKCLGGTLEEDAFSIQQTKDGGYIVAGYSYSNDGDVSGNHGGADYWIVKLNSAGTIQGQKCLGGTYDDWGTSIQQTKDGGYIVAGSSTSNDGDVSGHHGDIGLGDYWIVKLNKAGTIQRQKSLGGTSFDWANIIQQTIDGGYIVAGYSASNDGDVSGHHGAVYFSNDYWIVKLNREGNIQKEESFGGTSDDWATGIQQTQAGGYVVAGLSTSNDGDVSGNHGGFGDYWILKLKAIETTQNNFTSSYSNAVLEKNVNKATLHIQPNPSHNGMFTVDIGAIKNNVLISVTDNSGRQAYKAQFSSTQQFSIHLNNKPKGIYYLHVSYDGGVQTEKLVVE